MENKKYKILAIDDNQDNLISIKALLNDSFPDASVLLALSGQKGIELAMAENPDVILLDIVMPDMDGFEVCKKIKSIHNLCDIPIVFITAIKGDKASRILALECGAEAFLSKPIDESELVAQIRAMLKIRHANLQKYKENERLTDLVAEKTKALNDSNKITLQLLKEAQKDKALIEAIFDSIPGYLYVYDESGKLVKWNKQHESMTGYTTEELSHMTLDKWFSKDDIIKVNSAVQDVFEKGYGEVEAPLILKNGETMMTRSSGVPFTLDGHKYFTGIGLDVTERLKAEEALKESEEKFRYIFEHSTVGKSLTLPNGEIQINNTLCDMLGYTREELQGKHWTEISHPDDIELAQNEVDKLLSGKEKMIRFNKRYIRKDGSVLWADVQSSIRRDASGKPLYFMTTIVDITESVALQTRLTQAEEMFRAIFEQAPAGILLTDSVTAKVIMANQSFANITGRSLEYLYTHSWMEFTHPDDLQEDLDNMALVNAGKINGYQMNKRYLKPDGSVVWVSMKIVPIHGYLSFNQNRCHLCMIDDITYKMEYENRLKESEYLYRTFINATSDMVFLKDDKFKHIVVNQPMADFMGKEIPDIIGKDDFELLPEQIALHCRQTDSEVITTNKPQITEEVSGEQTFESTKFPVIFANHRIGVGGYVRNITNRKKAENELVYLSYHDFLTGLYNRRFFEEELRRLDIKRNYPLTLLMGDTNGLKLINDSFGHAVGDELLIKAAAMIKKACRGDDIIARLGGDEFGVILPNTGEMEAIQIINRITGMVSSESVLNVELSISFGYDIKETEDQSISETLSNAENNMYRNKLYERSSIRSKTIDVVMNTLFEKSNRESFHSKRVSELCKEIATKMNLDKDDIGKITIAGLVHDVGKIGVDEKILNKPGGLSEDEKKEIIKHPEIGWRILSSTDEFSELAVFILAHHEKWDGSGYPNGLQGDEIPVEARIIALADAYDAMTRDRTYRKGLSKEQAIQEIRSCSGKQFDPKIAEIFITEIIPYIADV